MRTRPFATVLTTALALCTSPLLADGIIVSRARDSDPNSIIVPERGQDAFIEHDGSRQRLYLATRAEAAEQPTVWIVPIPGDPAQVSAAPVARLPVVFEPEFPLPLARERVQEFGEHTLVADTGYVLLPTHWLLSALTAKKSVTFSTSDSALAGGTADAGVVVYSHVEALGMVVEVITARTAESLAGPS